MDVRDRLRAWSGTRLAIDVHTRVRELGGGFLASSVTLTMFLSLFPLLLVATAVLGFVSAGDNELAADLVEELGLTGDAADFVTDAIATAENSRAGTTILGFAGVVWVALGLAGAIEHLCDRAWQLPRRGAIGKLVAFVWLLGGMVLLAGSIGLTGLLGVLPGWLAPLQVVGAVALLVAFCLGTFRFLTSRTLPWSDHLPGAVVGGVGIQILTAAAAFIVPRQAAASSALWGSIGVVFALIAWLLLFGRLLVYAVVLNVVLHEREHGTVHVEVQAPRFDGEVPVAADRSAAVVHE
jgi:membrane protein